jgi:DNA-binding protein Alba
VEVEPSVAENMVLVGKKPAMNYVVACLTLFNSGKPTVIVRGRGLAISRAIDAVELLRKAFVKNLNIQDISIGTQEFMLPGNIESSTSTIEITISRPSSAVGGQPDIAGSSGRGL